MLNWIDNDLRNERNRCVHDLWQITGSSIRRIKQGAVVRKQPSSGDPKLEFGSVRSFGSKDELGEFHMDIYTATEEIDNIIIDLNLRIRALEEPPQELP